MLGLWVGQGTIKRVGLGTIKGEGLGTIKGLGVGTTKGWVKALQMEGLRGFKPALTSLDLVNDLVHDILVTCLLSGR